MSLTARAMTAPELTLDRTPGQFSKPYLAIAKYNTIYTARLATVPSSTDNVSQIAYNTGSGTLADVKAGMTLYVGSSAGAHDIGRLRLRKAPDATYFYIGTTSTIDWSAAATIYLTVVDDFALLTKPALWSAAMKMDADVAYSDQHSSFDPVPVLGPHEILWLTGATVSAHFSASDSWVIGSTISSYLWVAPGASATGSLNTATPTITYNAAGFYRVYCTVTAANGKTFMGVRHVFVYSAAAMPATKFQIRENPRADASSGGWSFGVTMYDEAALADVRDGALVILFAEDWYGTTKQSAGPITNRENIIAMGWIAGETIQWDTLGGSVEFTVQGPAGLLKSMPIHLYDMKFKASATKWAQMPSLNVQRALFHLFHWRTTITAIMDVKITGDARMSPNFQAPKGTVWGQIEEIAKKIFARPGVDRFGRLFVEIDPQMTTEASRTWATVMTVTDADRLNGIALRKVETMKPVSMLPTSGWQTNSSGKAVTLYSLAMGHFPLDFGSMDSPIDKLLVTDQTQGNEMAGLALGWKNNEWPDVPIAMPHNNRFIDCWPNQFLAATLDAADSPREEAFSGNLIPRAVELAWEPAINSFGVNVTCEAETFPTLAVNGDVLGDGGTIPPIPPPVEPPPPPPPPGGEDDHPTDVLIATSNFGLMYTQTFDEASPQWFFMNAGLTSDQYNNVQRIVRTPSGAIFIGVRTSAAPGQSMDYVFWSPGLGGAWTELCSLASIQAESGANSVTGILALGVNMNENEKISVIPFSPQTVLPYGYARCYLGNRSGISMTNDWTDLYKNAIGDMDYGSGAFLLSHSHATGVGGSLEIQAISKFSAAGVIQVDALHLPGGTSAAGSPVQYRRAGTGAIGYIWVDYNPITSMWRTDDNGANFTTINKPSSNLHACGIAVSPLDGLRIMGGGASVIGQRSSDGGATWGNIGTAGGMTVGYDVWENCGDNSRWLAGAGNIMLTLDWGDNWIGKNGDLLTLAPLVDITQIKYIAG